MSTQRISLLTIDLMIRIHIMADPRGHHSWYTTAGENTVIWLEKQGLIDMRPGDEIPQATARGRAWLSMLQATPLPEPIAGFSDPRTGRAISET